jgi:hypothetical protein
MLGEMLGFIIIIALASAPCWVAGAYMEYKHRKGLK